MKDEKVPLVSICMITYNHEKFIQRSIEGVLMQKRDFEIELVISNDKSQDNTDLMIKKIIKEHEDGGCIKYFSQKNNLGITPNMLFGMSNCRGKYVAFCEGDDFWIDSEKLQKQVDFMEANPEYSLCGSKAQTMDEEGNRGESGGNKIGEVSLDEVLKRNQFITCTSLYRSEYLVLPPLPKYTDFFTGDWPLWASLLSNGKGYNFECITAQYNIHAGGATSGRSMSNMLKNKLNDRTLMIESFPAHRKTIKNYGNKILFHFLWKSFMFKSNYYTALIKNRELVLNYLRS